MKSSEDKNIVKKKNMEKKELKKPILKIMRFLGFGIEGIYRLGYFAVAVGIILAVHYLMGHRLLGGIYGNDAANAINNIVWISRYFPKIPFWYPLQGGGVSMVWNYPMLSSILIVLLSKISSLGLLASMQVMVYASFGLTAIGMYLFVWLRLKNQTAGLLAAVFFLLLPLTYGWLIDWGFYAEALSYMFFFPTLIFYDYFLEGCFKKSLKWHHRFSLLLAALSGVLLFNTHPLSFVVMMFIVVFQTLVWGLVVLKNKRKQPVMFIVKALLPSLTMVIVTMMLTAFTVFNFMYYNKAKTFPGSVSGETTHQLFVDLNEIPSNSFIGLGRIPNDHFQFTLRSLVVPPVVWVLALVGMVTTLLFYRKVFGYVILSVFGLAVTQNAGLFYKLVQFLTHLPIPNFYLFFQQRSYLMMVRYFFPIAAAFGIVGVGRLIFEIGTVWLRLFKLPRLLDMTVKWIRNILIAGFALGAFGYALYMAADYPSNLWRWYQARYGYWLVDTRDPFGQVGFSTDNIVPMSREGDFSIACGVLVQAGRQFDICDRIVGEADQMRVKAIIDDFMRECKANVVPDSELELCPLAMNTKQEVYLSSLRYLSKLHLWPRQQLLSDEKIRQMIFPSTLYDEFLEKVKDEKNLRVGVSARSGGVTQGLNVIRPNISMIQLYTSTASIIGPYWGYEQDVLFTGFDEKTGTVNEVARWFGTKYIFINPTYPMMDKYANSSLWESEVDFQGNSGMIKFKDATEMATWDKNKPVVLVIGNKERRAYEPFFRASTRGGWLYKDGFLVEGEERIDAYSLKELQKFDMVYLFGYTYRNRGRAFELMDAYIRNGGESIF